MPNPLDRAVEEQASIDRLRADADGARSVADGNPDVLESAANLDLAADELEQLRSLSPDPVEEGLEVTADDRARLREIARLIEVDSRRDDAQRDARFLHRFAERPSITADLEERVRERLEAARKDRDGVALLDAARALCPDGAAWEDEGWERYLDDASCCILAFLDALNPTLDALEKDQALGAQETDPANLRACAANVIAAWDNQSPGSEKWDRLRQKIEYLRGALR